MSGKAVDGQRAANVLVGGRAGVLEDNDVTCKPYKTMSSSVAVSLTASCFPLLVLDADPWPDRDFFHPSFAPIFFQPLSREFFGLVLGDMTPVSEVGGVVGGVIGSPAEGDGELPLSSVISFDSDPDRVDELVR